MKGIVWYKHKTRGEEVFNKIVKSYETLRIKPVKERRSQYETCIIFENDDVWKLISAKESSRGQRCNISYIERGIERDIINCVIKPCTLAFPFAAYNYY